MLVLALALLIVACALYVWVPALLLYWIFPWPVYVLLVGAVGAAVASRRAGWRRWATLGLASLITVLFVLYTLVFSRLSHGELAVRPGDPFPDFTLQTSTKEAFSPAQLRGQRAALYIFYRGDW